MLRKLLAPPENAPAPVWVDRLMRGILIGGGALILGLLVWFHLGLSTVFFPPAASPTHQTAQVGAYTLIMQATSGQMTTGGPNTIAFTLQNSSGQSVTYATLQIDPQMTTMPMSAPHLTLQAQPNGQYIAHPLFTMAGVWQLQVTLTMPSQPSQETTFQVSVRLR
jgi:hypothetical protein